MNTTDLPNIYSQWLESNVKPNVVAVFTIKQSIVTNHCGSPLRSLATPDIIEAEYDKFIRRLSKAAYGKKTWKRFAKRVPSFASLEGNGCRPMSGVAVSKKTLAFAKATQSVGKAVRYHLNVSFRKPDHLSFDEFRDIVARTWNVSHWALPDVLIQPRVGNFTAYSCKEGPEAILAKSICF
jgi:hypothetical protein